jgi:hypothetical protein
MLAWADKPRQQHVFLSDNGRFVLLLTHGSTRRVPMFENGQFSEYAKVWNGEGETWGVFDALDAEPFDDSSGFEVTWSPLYTFKGDFSSRTMFVGNDGRSVTVVDDYSVREPAEDLEVLHFLDEGWVTKVYTLGQLLDDTDNARWTASHFYWLLSRSLRYEEERLQVVTTECRKLEFDVRTGEISNESLADACARVFRIDRDNPEITLDQFLEPELAPER